MSEPTEGPTILEHISTHWHVVGDPLQFVMRYAAAVRRYVGALVKDPHDSEDVVQDFLLRTVRRPFTPEQIRRGRFRDYLKAVLRNAALTHFRRSARLPMSRTDHLAGIATKADDAADRAWLAGWRECLLRRAWQALELHEQASPEGMAYTVLRLTADYPDEPSAALAARATALTGRVVGVDAFRKQLSRARRHFAQMIVDEIRKTLEEIRADYVMEELRDLGLMEYVRDFLPEPFRSAAAPGQP
jgi:DNA-directed RNA polymerase specialized sigma24 family protein